MHEHASARRAVETMIRSGDLEGLLQEAGILHGHRCPMLALGVKAGQYALSQLFPEGEIHGVTAILEALNCFADGIQLVTGCTLGNGGLVVKDLGKTAVTVARHDGAAVRLLVRPDFRERLFSKYPTVQPLFDKVVLKVTADHEERHRFEHMWSAVARRELDTPMEEQFLIKSLKIQAPHPRRRPSGVVCSRCGEGVAESRIRVKDGQSFCLACAGESFFVLTGEGITGAPGMEHL
jgi:formylmethanofuran dehydrogenase subunit E